MNTCDLCGEDTRKYPVELMTDGIIRLMLVCEGCYNMVGAGEKKSKGQLRKNNMTNVQTLINLQKAREKRLTRLSEGMLHPVTELAKVDMLIADSQNLMTDIEIQDRFLSIDR